MRIIAGDLRGRRLRSTRLPLRPTSDRLRETLFDVLSAARPLAGARWLDLYAGTGAVGIEALSRGASFVCFVESSREAIALVRANLADLGLGAAARVLHAPAARSLRQLAQEADKQKFDICFLDPPYSSEDEYRSTLSLLAGSQLLAAGALVVAEHSKRFAAPETAGSLARFRRLQQGDAALSFYKIV